MFLRVLTGVLLFFGFISCSQIKYEQVKIGSIEQSVNFQKVIPEEITGPEVVVAEGQLYWYSSKYIDLSDNGKLIVYSTAQQTKGETQYTVHIQELASQKEIFNRTITGDLSGFCFQRDTNLVFFSSFFGGKNSIHQINPSTNEINLNYMNSKGNEINPCVNNQNELLYAEGTNDLSLAVHSKSEKKNPFIEYSDKSFNINAFNKSTLAFKTISTGINPDVVKGSNLMVFCRMNPETGCNELWTRNLTTTAEKPLLKFRTMGFSTPALSPDGKKVVFVGSSKRLGRKTPMNLNLYVVNMDGTGFKQLTSHPGNDLSPVWSPDMKSIYFISERGDAKRKYHIWKMDF